MPNTPENANGDVNGTEHAAEKPTAGDEQIAAHDDKSKEDQTADRKITQIGCANRASC